MRPNRLGSTSVGMKSPISASAFRLRASVDRHLKARLADDADDLFFKVCGPPFLLVEVHGHLAGRAHEFLIRGGQGLFDIGLQLRKRNIAFDGNLV